MRVLRSLFQPSTSRFAYKINLGNELIQKQIILQLSDHVCLSMAIPLNFNVDKEWATGLVGLRMKVPDSWWVYTGSSTSNNDSSGNELHAGRIHSMDFEQTKNVIFKLQLDDVDEPD